MHLRGARAMIDTMRATPIMDQVANYWSLAI